MKNWINRNYKTIIISAFLIPIITVAIVSISHVTKWYGISNPVTWAVYLSIGVEIAALSALAAISANMGRKVYFPFGIVTLVQFIGNIYFAYSYIDITTPSFISWVELVSPLLEILGVEPTDLVGHKRFLAFFAGGMLPIISLSFLHMLVKFTEEDRLKTNEVIEEEKKEEKKEETSVVEAKDIVGEVSRIRLSDKDLEILEKILNNPPPPNDNLVKESEQYKEKIEEETGISEEIVEKIKEQYEDRGEFGMVEDLTKEESKEILSDMMQKDEELGLYESPYGKPLVEEPIVSDDFTIGPEGAFEMTEEILEELKQEPITPALSDEEVREMFMDEWERKFELVEEEEDDLPIIEIKSPEPTIETPTEISIPETTPTPQIEEPQVIETGEVNPEVIEEPEIIIQEVTSTIQDQSLPTVDPEEEKKNN